MRYHPRTGPPMPQYQRDAVRDVWNTIDGPGQKYGNFGSLRLDELRLPSSYITACSELHTLL